VTVRLNFRAPRSTGEERHAAALVAVLAGVFLVAAGLAFQSWRDDRARRIEAEEALRRTGTFAVAAYRTRVEAVLWNALVAVFRPVGGRLGRDGDPPPLAALAASVDAAKRCRCAPVLTARFLFRFDLRTGELEIAGAEPPPHVPRWLAAGIPWHTRPGHLALEFDTMVDTSASAWEPVFFTFFRDAGQRALVAYGFSTDGPSLVQAVFDPIFQGRPLLAPIIADSLPNPVLFTLGVVAGGRRTLYGLSDPSPLATTRLAQPMGDLGFELSLQPGAADRLLPGGMPRPRTPLLLAIVGATGALVLLGIRLARRASALARQRADFTASVSHELRTPLAEILLFAETMALGRYRAVSDYRREAGVIVQEGRRLLHLVENVLHVSRAERAGAKPPQRPASLAPVVRRALDGFGPMAAARGATIRTELDDAVTAPVDGPAFERVVVNLVDNAVKYAGHAGPVTISLGRRRDRAEIRVDDAGPGVPAADRERIWEPFVRLARDHDDARTGGGLGLTVVRDIVRSHGGTAHVETSPSGGARFVVRIPGAAYSEETD
jgi:signal transduction histidine kinase